MQNNENATRNLVDACLPRARGGDLATVRDLIADDDKSLLCPDCADWFVILLG